MSEINTKWYDEYIRKQLDRDRRRYGLQDLQQADLDDLKHDLFLAYLEEITEKQSYVKANNLQAYFSKVLHNYLIKWAIKRTKESKRMVSIRHAMEMVIPYKGKLDLRHECLRGLGLKERVMVVLRYAADWTVEEIAEVVEMNKEAVYKAIQRAVEKIKENGKPSN